MNTLGRLRFGIFSRIYLFGLLQLACMAVAVGLLIDRVVEPIENAESIRVGGWIIDRVWAEQDVASRRELIRTLRDDADIEVALYDATGKLLAGSDATEPRDLSVDILARVEREGRFLIEPLDALAIGEFVDERLVGVAVARSLSVRGVSLGLGTLLGILVVIALLAWPLARSLSVPIRQLNRAMTRFGRGDMDARANLSRRDELGELSRAYDEMAERIVALLRAEKLLIAGVAHELRTPLQRIRIAIELASDESGAEGDPVPQRFEAMLEDLRDLEHIIANVLTVARLESARAGANQELLRHREHVAAELLLRECALKFEMRHPDRQLDLVLDDALPEIAVERQLMAMAVSNLLENAHEYSPPGETIELRARVEGSRLLVEVIDRGIGIGSEHLTDVFKPFFRTDAARSSSHGGAGLGLAIVKGVVESHDGEVSVRSVKGEGTRFCIALRC